MKTENNRSIFLVVQYIIQFPEIAATIELFSKKIKYKSTNIFHFIVQNRVNFNQ